LLTLLGALVVVIWGVGIYVAANLEGFILIGIVPLIPAFVILIRQAQTHLEAGKKLDILKSHVDSIWADLNNTTSNEKLEKLSADIQSAIFDNRSSNPLIFNWIYNWLREDSEDRMNIGAEELVKQFLTNDATQA
jgi:hypothetical protein